jgi:hypothetical protein
MPPLFCDLPRLPTEVQSATRFQIRITGIAFLMLLGWCGGAVVPARVNHCDTCTLPFEQRQMAGWPRARRPYAFTVRVGPVHPCPNATTSRVQCSGTCLLFSARLFAHFHA